MRGRPKKYTDEQKRIKRNLEYKEWYIKNKEKLLEKQSKLRRERQVKEKKKYSTDEERKQAKREREEKRRRKLGIPIRSNYTTLDRKEQWKAYYYRNQEKHKIRRAKFNKNNKELRRSYGIKRRQIKNSVFESLTKKLIKEIYFKFNLICYNCKSDNDLCLDHHYPLSLGNPLTINNAVLLCRSCNSKKGAKLPESFYSPEQLTDLQDNYGITKSPIEEKQLSLFEARMPKNLERDNGILEAMNAA